MRIAIVGGGPGGLYLAALCLQLDPTHEITVWERNAPDDTFGFGVVFSDETLGGIEHADVEVYRAMEREFARWDDIDVHYRGQVLTSGGHGFSAMSRRRLLEILQQRCRDLGATLHFRTEAPDVDVLSAEYDLVVASDGLNSAIRTKYADTFGPDLDVRACRYMWLGTSRVFDAFTFAIEQTPFGAMQVHAYPYDATGSTFIIEMHDDVWRAAGFDATAGRVFAPGESDEDAIDRVRELFPDLLGGYDVMSNNSRWISFTTVRNRTWHRGNVILLGDSAHTAHFSIGSGTKLAMEDSLALAACLHENPDIATALAAYELERKPVVESTQRAAQASLEWFENLGQYVHQEPMQFAFNMLTRSRRVTHANLKLRDPEFTAAADTWFAGHERDRGVLPGSRTATPEGALDVRPPMFQPFRLRGLDLRNRVVVSAMDMYVATDGYANDFHLTHLGSKALGGAGLVMTEMVCVSAQGRITPGCTGLYEDGHTEAYRRVVDLVHSWSGAKIGVQLGHSGRKGSTKLMWEGMDEPLTEGNWPVIAPSPLPWTADNQTPDEATTDDLDRILDQFVESARRADQAGFDLLELHCAHGYLLSGFLSPLTNHRTDEYGGDLTGRLRYPLRVFDAVRAVWPEHKPMSVRISATDWFPGGTEAQDAVEIARAFAEHGVDVVDVSTGQVVADQQPAFGRSYQTPYADRIRNMFAQEGRDVATLAVGAISSHDDLNSIVLAGRADLCALGRTHLYDPQWTLHAAADQGYAGPGAEWPDPFKAGSRPPAAGRVEDARPRLQLVRDGETTTRHARWRPTR